MPKHFASTTRNPAVPASGGRNGRAISLHIPRLADFRHADKSSLISPAVVRGVMRAVELTVTVGIGLIIALLYVPEPDLVSNHRYLMTVGLIGLATVFSFEVLGLYSLASFSSFLRSSSRLLLGWTIVLALLVVVAFFLKIGPEFSRVWLATWFMAGGTALVGGRLVARAMVHRWARQGRLYRRAVIYGTGPVTEELLAELESDDEIDLRISGVFDDREDERSARLIAGYPRMGGLADLLAFARNTRIDLVIVALPVTAEQRLADVLKRLIVLPADIKLPARATQLRLCPRSYSHIGSVAMIDLVDKPIRDWGRLAKWALDKSIAMLAVVLLAPVMATTALAIKLDSRGPVLFRQKRYGFNNELIEIFKFRSMHTEQCDADASKLVTRQDPRVTRVGRFIRRTSLDELPQLFNVLKGELSLVGPRPHALAAKAGSQLYDEVVDEYFARHKVKPGITGWAQINGWRGETDTPEKIRKRVEHDLYYIENWSLFLDLYILARTPFALLQTDNAY